MQKHHQVKTINSTANLLFVYIFMLKIPFTEMVIYVKLDTNMKIT